MIINNAILHILDFNSGLSVYSQEALNTTVSAVVEFIECQIDKAFSDDRIKQGTFLPESSAKTDIENYMDGKIDFIALSAELAKNIYDTAAISDRPVSMDVIVCDFTLEEKRQLAILLNPYKTYYTHQISPVDIGFKNELIQHFAILPALSQKLDEFAIIDLTSYEISFVDKRRNIDGHNAYIFKDYVLKCSSGISQKETIKIMTKIADRIAEDNGQSGTEAIARVKTFISENAEASDELKPIELVQEVFADSEYMQSRFEEKIKEAGIPEQIKVDKEVAVKATKNHKIKTDTGIEIIYPSDYLNNSNYINIINNPDGTISIEINNIGKITSRI